MVSFINDHREAYGVEPICRMLPIAPSTYFEQKARAADPRRLPARLARDRELRVEIERVWKENQSVYGARRVWKQLKREGFEVARCTVERLMAAMRLQGRRLRPCLIGAPCFNPHVPGPTWPTSGGSIGGSSGGSIVFGGNGGTVQVVVGEEALILPLVAPNRESAAPPFKNEERVRRLEEKIESLEARA
jgi:hypothetical protein